MKKWKWLNQFQLWDFKQPIIRLLDILKHWDTKVNNKSYGEGKLCVSMASMWHDMISWYEFYIWGISLESNSEFPFVLYFQGWNGLWCCIPNPWQCPWGASLYVLWCLSHLISTVWLQFTTLPSALPIRPVSKFWYTWARVFAQVYTFSCRMYFNRSKFLRGRRPDLCGKRPDLCVHNSYNLLVWANRVYNFVKSIPGSWS